MPLILKEEGETKEGSMKKWEALIKENYHSIRTIKERIPFSDEEVKAIQNIEERYPISVPGYYLSLIQEASHTDPVRRMCIPDPLEFSEGGTPDTSGEADNTVVQGMQHKYARTALILSTNVCAMYCRHCFRKRMVGLSSEETAKHIPEMAEYVRNHPEIDNVLISGGDAFMNSDAVIRQYLEAFTAIPNIKLIRFGTRTPVTFPYRITEDDGELEALLKEFSEKKAIMIVTHYNHPLELTDESRKAIRILQRAGCIVRNQTVLLHGVNDDPATLSDLMSSLVSINIEPYYVFQCRPVEGVKNQFQVPLSRGAAIVREAKGTMNGPAKAFRYAMSHPTGKIEILGEINGRMLFSYHQAKYEKDNGRIFTRPLSESEAWFEDPDRI